MNNSATGPINNAELRCWQRRSYKLLGELLVRHPRLPTISWLVSDFTLTGHSAHPDPHQRRRAFEAWVDALGLERCSEETGTATSGLYARRRNYIGRGVDVAVTTDPPRGGQRAQ